MGSTRRTDAETFALGMWAGTAVNELDALINGSDRARAMPLAALRTLITDARDTADLATLVKLRRAWATAGDQFTATPAKDTTAKGTPEK